MSENLELRPAVQWFAQQMERKLRANDHKPGWHESTTWELIRGLEHELGELHNASFPNRAEADPDTVIGEAADVANFAMMIADNANIKWKFGRRD